MDRRAIPGIWVLLVLLAPRVLVGQRERKERRVSQAPMGQEDLSAPLAFRLVLARQNWSPKHTYMTKSALATACMALTGLRLCRVIVDRPECKVLLDLPEHRWVTRRLTKPRDIP